MHLSDTFFTHPASRRWQRGFRLAFVVITLRQFQLAGGGNSLRLHRQNWSLATGYQWTTFCKRCEEFVQDGIATWSVETTESGDYGTLTLLEPLAATPAPEPSSPSTLEASHQPRRQYPSDFQRKEKRNGHSAETPQPLRNGLRTEVRNGSANYSAATPPRASAQVSETVPETIPETEGDIYPQDVSETIRKLVSETAPQDSANRSATDSTPTHQSHIRLWRQTNERLANQSAQILQDANSLAYHIKLWNHARKVDRARGNEQLLNTLLDLLRHFRDVQANEEKPQGRQWCRAVRLLFERQGVPLEKDAAAPEEMEAGELEAVRAAVAASLASVPNPGGSL